MKRIIVVLLIVFITANISFADDCSIVNINPTFNPETPGFGNFDINVALKNNLNTKSKITVTCLYVGIVKPEIYLKNKPQIMKNYQLVELEPLQEKTIIFQKGFRSYHPEMTGEIIVSITGSGKIRSIPLQTGFHPKSEE